MNLPAQNQKHVLVTGASTGIGEATALLLAAKGFRVFAGVRKDVDFERYSKLKQRSLQPVKLDVTNSEQLTKSYDFIANEIGGSGLAGIVNNAGIVVAGPLEYLAAVDLRAQFEVNVIGVHEATRTFLPLIRLGNGRIVNVGSISGRMSFPFVGPYGASKFAIEGLTDALRRELRPFGIRVSLVEPGRIRTPIWEKSLKTNEERRLALPKAAEIHYGVRINKMRDFTRLAEKKGSEPEKVARAIYHALTAKIPKTRYVVGGDAKTQAFVARFVPDSVVDYFVGKIL